LDLRIPMLDVHTLGAGGGSIAWIDRGGALRVGPQSAGADPGPVCYGLGGRAPTVTDANLVLGRLSPNYFLGGEMELDLEAARRALRDCIAAPLGLSLERAAHGIIQVVNANMLRGMRVVSVERGYDPRDFALVAFGGAGPLHAADLAQELGVQKAVVPNVPGVTSAYGLLVADFRHDHVQTYVASLDGLHLGELNGRFASLETEATGQLLSEDVAPENIVLSRSAEMRYVGQGHSLELPVPSGRLDARALERLKETFHSSHQRSYGYAMAEEAIEIAGLRVSGIGRRPKPERRPAEQVGTDPREAQKDTRQVWFRQAYWDTPVYERRRLQVGNLFAGPAVVEQLDSTVLIPPGVAAEVDAWGNIVLDTR